MRWKEKSYSLLHFFFITHYLWWFYNSIKFIDYTILHASIRKLFLIIIIFLLSSYVGQRIDFDRFFFIIYMKSMFIAYFFHFLCIFSVDLHFDIIFIDKFVLYLISSYPK